METIKFLVIGAGISGLGVAASLAERGERELLVLEADAEIGGYCKTVRTQGFVWDYSGHFFHFKHPEIEAWLRERMPGQRVVTVNKRAFIDYQGQRIDFPFQKNIHQLDRESLIDCLHDLYFADLAAQSAPPGAPAPASFSAMLMARFGRAICEKFLIPYNEKLYATSLDALDPEAMGRFFPHASLREIVANMRAPDNSSYNSTFTYPEGGAIEYVRALERALPSGSIATEERVIAIDRQRRRVTTTKRELGYEHLISSMPLPSLLKLSQLEHDPGLFSWSQVLVFNLGFDRKGETEAHWMYFPARELAFYRVGFYDNIFSRDRMSLYIELGYPRGASIDVATARARVLADLERVGIVRGHRLLAEHSVVMDPAYVHMTTASLEEVPKLRARLEDDAIFSIGRYGGWTYCSIEDNLVEARALAERLSAST